MGGTDGNFGKRGERFSGQDFMLNLSDETKDLLEALGLQGYSRDAVGGSDLGKDNGWDSVGADSTSVLDSENEFNETMTSILGDIEAFDKLKEKGLSVDELRYGLNVILKSIEKDGQHSAILSKISEENKNEIGANAYMTHLCRYHLLKMRSYAFQLDEIERGDDFQATNSNRTARLESIKSRLDTVKIS